MQPLIVANEVRSSVADFLATAFPSTTPGFQGLIERFLAQPENLFRGPCLTIALPFRPGGPVERVVEYLAPFARADREADYRAAWAHFAQAQGANPC